MKEYLSALLVTCIISATVRIITPDGAVKKYIKTLCSLCVACVVITPIIGGISSLYDIESRFSELEYDTENYDEIYGTEEVVEETVEEVVPENSEPEVVPEVVEEASEPTIDTPDTSSENEEVEVEEIIINDDEEDEESGIPGIIYNYSFEAKLSLSDYQTKTYYESIIRFIKSYGVKIIRSWKKERIYLGRKQFAVLSFRGKRLSVSLALDPKDYIDSKYRFTDVSEIKKYINTPMMMKLTSDRKLKHTLELLGVIFKKAELEQNVQNVSFKKVAYQSKNSLIKKGLIKVKEKQPV